MRPCDLSNILGQLDADDLNRLDRKTREVVRGWNRRGSTGRNRKGTDDAPNLYCWPVFGSDSRWHQG